MFTISLVNRGFLNFLSIAFISGEFQGKASEAFTRSTEFNVPMNSVIEIYNTLMQYLKK